MDIGSNNSVIIVAGGSGNRMKSSIPKQFICLNELPILMHTINTFYNYNSKIEIIVVLPIDNIDYWKSLCDKHKFNIKHTVVEGGETRFNSVKNGLKHTSGNYVAIHDGVRPFVSIETLTRCFKAVKENNTAVPVIDVHESIREISNNKNVARQRDLYKLVQTPQVFEARLIKECYKCDYNPNFTDDASVAEASGYEITLVDGNRENIKLTSPFDLTVASAILNNN